MADVPRSFRAFVAEQVDDRVERGVRELDAGDLPDGDVTVRVAYSSVNYKDALASAPGGKVARISPLVPGIDLAGEVLAGGATDVGVGDVGVGDVGVGDRVLVHGYDLGVARHGGYAEFARVPADWVVPLPAGLDVRRAMAIGTAGFTAGLSVQALEERGLRPEAGPVLVTGATGGVGSVAVGILAERGYEVVASTGKQDAHDWLRALGASSVLDRSQTSSGSRGPLERARWVGAVDCVGGATLAYVLRTLQYGAAVAASGLTGGADLATTVLPFILRGVALLGIDSVQCSIGVRRAVWERLATDYAPRGLEDGAVDEVGLEGIEPVLDRILSGTNRGRTVVRVTPVGW